MVHRYCSTNFVILSFSGKVEATVVRDILRGGIVINGEEYQFIGCSSGGLKSRTCYMYKGSLLAVERIWAECGEFSLIKSRYKRLKRIGLLFSSALSTGITIPLSDVREIPDIESGDHIFTDGCGGISKELANQLVERCKIEGKPSVFQIRYQGCKGVVAIDNSLDGKTLAIRPSMKKFKNGTKPFNELWLCDYSRPYSFGHLNRQFITLLSSLGVPDKAFLAIQSEYFELLQNVTRSTEAAFQMLLLDNQAELAIHCADAGFLVKYSFRLTKLKAKALSKLEKLRLPILKSRNVFGVCDTTGQLKYGQCYFRFVDHGQSKTLQGKVVVAKNPCYLLGDVRVLTAVDVPDLDHLVDCIVFPTRGKRPHPSEIAGSDLDGDRYFVCWDERLIVLHVREPYNYPSVVASETNPDISQEVLIDFFASQRNSMGKIDCYYKYWANKNGAGCEQCQTLGQLFSRSVDATKTGDVVSVPPHLVPPQEPESELTTIKPHVWEIMEKQASKKKDELSKEVISKAEESETDVLTEDFLWSLLENRISNITEFQLLSLISRWCNSQHSSGVDLQQKFLEFVQHLHFGELSLEEQITAINMGVPLKTVTNALNCSALPKTLLNKFLLDDPHHNWRFYFRASPADFKWNNLLRGLQTHPESLLIIKLLDEVTFVIQFRSEVTLGESNLGIDSVVTYFSSGHFSLNLQATLGSDYKVTLDKDKLQIYQGKAENTFIWLRGECQAKQPSSHRKTQDKDVLFGRISVDLTRFKKNVLRSHNHPKVNKQCFLSIEMFVKTECSQPAYLDYAEADIQSDYPIEEELLATNDIQELPCELTESVDDLLLESPVPDSKEAALTLITECLENGNIANFRKALEVVSKSENSDEQIFLLFLKLMNTLLKKFCHVDLPDKVEDCLCLILKSLHQRKASATLVLHLLSVSSQLRLCKLMAMIFDSVLPVTEVTKFSEYLDAVGKWQLWYYLPPNIASKLSENFYTLYSSLYNQSILSSEKTETLPQLMEIASNLAASDISIKQHKAEKYSLHFSHLIHNHLLSEMYDLKHQQECHNCDSTSSLVKMQCYDYEQPHDSATSVDDVEDNSEQPTWKVGFKRTDKGISSKNFTLGSYVSIHLMTKQSSTSDIQSRPIAIGLIVKTSRHPADVVVEVTKPVPVCLRKCAQLGVGHWKLALVGNITLYNRSLRTLKSLSDSSKCATLLSLLIQTHKLVSPHLETEAIPVHPQHKLATDDTSLPKEKLSHESHLSLNLNQQKAVFAALSQRLTMIHGPPGTGKTHVACEIAQQQLYRDGENPILVVAETNMAVDNLCEKLLSRDIHVIRIGKIDQISPPLRGISLEGQIEKKRIQEGKDKTRSQYPSKSLAMPIIKAAQVVAATCTSSGDPNLKGVKFPFVIVDEATQVTEPTSLIPLMHGCQQLTLIGDPEQLAPNVTMSHSSDFHNDELSTTLFHRLQKLLPLNSVFLNVQHRMHSDLVEFPSAKFYSGRLVTSKSRLEQPSIFQESEDIPLILKNAPHAFINVEQGEERIGTSFCNSAEAKVVADMIKMLISCKISTQQVAVLTPYSGQIKCIQEHCLREKINHAKLHTIDSFQGRESDVIIFSSVRCNPSNELGFINDRYRMNVLLTRARHCLIGIGSENTLSSGSQLWKEWLATVKVVDNEDFSKMNIGSKATGARPHIKKEEFRPSPQDAARYHGPSENRSSRQRSGRGQRGRGGNEQRGGGSRRGSARRGSFDAGGARRGGYREEGSGNTSHQEHQRSQFGRGEFTEHSRGASHGCYRGRDRPRGQYSKQRDRPH